MINYFESYADFTSREIMIGHASVDFLNAILDEVEKKIPQARDIGYKEGKKDALLQLKSKLLDRNKPKKYNIAVKVI